jgi:hypothetical protein
MAHAQGLVAAYAPINVTSEWGDGWAYCMWGILFFEQLSGNKN